MSALEEKSAGPAAASGVENDDGNGGSAIAAGIRRDVKPWLNLVDDLSNLTRDAEISVPQVCVNNWLVSRVIRESVVG